MRQPVTRECLLSHFRAGFRPRPTPLIGLEYEMVGTLADTGRALPYDGQDASVLTILDRMCQEFGWHPVGGEPLLELNRDGSRITLEPGGQIELSLRPHGTLSSVESELLETLSELRLLADPLGVRLLPLGMQPLSTPEQIRIIPKERYRIMTRYLPTRGGHGLWMMRTTAGMQVNLDVASPEEAAEALRLALCFSSLLLALFANSPLSAGRENGWLSRRGHIWLDVDPDRCGIPAALVEPEAGVESYIDWALDARMFFVSRGEHLCDLSGIRFGDYLEGGRAGLKPMLADWETHLTTLFPEARLKSYLEIRCADSNTPDLAMAYAALCVGLFYGGREIRRQALARLEGWSHDQRVAFHAECARHGLRAAAPAGGTAGDLVREMLVLAAAGLEEYCPDERHFLAPAEKLAAEDRCPGHSLLERWRGPWKKSIPAAIADLALSPG